MCILILSLKKLFFLWFGVGFWIQTWLEVLEIAQYVQTLFGFLIHIGSAPVAAAISILLPAASLDTNAVLTLLFFFLGRRSLPRPLLFLLEAPAPAPKQFKFYWITDKNVSPATSMRPLQTQLNSKKIIIAVQIQIGWGWSFSPSIVVYKSQSNHTTTNKHIIQVGQA